VHGTESRVFWLGHRNRTLPVLYFRYEDKNLANRSADSASYGSRILKGGGWSGACIRSAKATPALSAVPCSHRVSRVSNSEKKA